MIAALDEQRDLRIRQREARRAELESLEEGVRSAVETPLPDDGEETAEVSRRVLEAIETGEDGSDEDYSGTPDRPDVIARDERQEREREDVPNGAPPDPRGPGDESANGSDEPDARADGPSDGADRGSDRGDGGSRGPIGEVLDAVGSVLAGGPGGGGAPAAGPSGRASDAARTVAK